MIYDRLIDKVVIDGKTYGVRDPIIGTEGSIYEGLYGEITEIRDGGDREFEDRAADIYCDFQLPVKKSALEEARKRLLENGYAADSNGNIDLSDVIVAPSMIEPIAVPTETRVYVISEELEAEDLCRDDNIHQVTIFTEYTDAKHAFEKKVIDERTSGIVSEWKKCAAFFELPYSDTRYEYECWKGYEYKRNHYSISLSREILYYRDYSPAVKDMTETVIKNSKKDQ